MKKVTVLMPVYNGEKHIRQAINSILSQTFSDFELIIVNDGSTDATANIVTSYNDARIRLINLEINSGLVNALNIGVEESRGDLLARFDHDDIASPERLEYQIKAMEDPDVVICGSSIRLIGKRMGGIVSYPAEDGDIRAVMPVVTPFAHPAVMMRTKICQRLRYSTNAARAEDYELWWRIAQEGRMVNLDKCLISYRIHAGQVTDRHKDEQYSMAAKISANNLISRQIFRSSEDIDCHRRCLALLPLDSLDQLDMAGDWLSWLKDYSGLVGSAVGREYGRVWRGICATQTHLGYDVWRIYKKYTFCQESSLGNIQVASAAFLGIGRDNKMVENIRNIIRR